MTDNLPAVVTDGTKTVKDTKFKPGNKLGKGRQPKIIAIEKIAQDHGLDTFKRALEIAKDPKHKNHWDAIQLVLAYAYGKPRQVAEIKSEGEILHTFTWMMGVIE